MSGPFLFSLAGMLLAILVLNIGLRPDPIDLARAWDEADGVPPHRVGHRAGAAARWPPGLAAVRASPGATLGIATIVVAHLVMVGVMSMTPVHLKDLAATPGHAMHGGTADILVVIGFVISLHIAGMYALSPFIGALADRIGQPRMMLAGQGMLVAAVLVGGPRCRIAGRRHHGPGAAGAGLVDVHRLRLGIPGRTGGARPPRAGPGCLRHPHGRGRGAGRRRLRPAAGLAGLCRAWATCAWSSSWSWRSSACASSQARKTVVRPGAGAVCRACVARGSSSFAKIIAPSSPIPSWWNSSVSQTRMLPTAAAVSSDSSRST